MKSSVANFSEIAPLKKVLMHRPGDEFLNLTPNTLERLLFDDIPYLMIAQQEHDAYANALRAEGVEVVYLPRTPEISSSQIKKDLYDANAVDGESKTNHNDINTDPGK